MSIIPAVYTVADKDTAKYLWHDLIPVAVIKKLNYPITPYAEGAAVVEALDTIMTVVLLHYQDVPTWYTTQFSVVAEYCVYESTTGYAMTV
jgi:hypothetical protein